MSFVDLKGIVRCEIKTSIKKNTKISFCRRVFDSMIGNFEWLSDAVRVPLRQDNLFRFSMINVDFPFIPVIC